MRKSSPAFCFFFSFSLLSLSLDVRSKAFYQLFIIGYPRSVGARMDLFNWTHKKLYEVCDHVKPCALAYSRQPAFTAS